MDEKKLADFLFEMSEKSVEKSRALFGKDMYYEGIAAGINVASTVIRERMYEDSTAESCANQAITAATIAEVARCARRRGLFDD